MFSVELLFASHFGSIYFSGPIVKFNENHKKFEIPKNKINRRKGLNSKNKYRNILLLIQLNRRNYCSYLANLLSGIYFSLKFFFSFSIAKFLWSSIGVTFGFQCFKKETLWTQEKYHPFFVKNLRNIKKILKNRNTFLFFSRNFCSEYT